jgi:HEAT repeat protein
MTRFLSIFILVAILSIQSGALASRAEGVPFEKYIPGEVSPLRVEYMLSIFQSHEVYFNNLREASKSFLEPLSGMSDEEIIASRLELINKKSPSLDAIAVLGAMGPKAAPAVAELSRLLLSEDDIVVRHAIWALGEIGPAAAPAAEAISDQIRKVQDSFINLHAIYSLGAIGPEVAPLASKVFESYLERWHRYEADVYETLVKMEIDRDSFFAPYFAEGNDLNRLVFFLSQHKIYDQSLIPPVTGLLKNASGLVIHSAASYLGEAGKPTSAVMQALIDVVVNYPVKKSFRDLDRQKGRVQINEEVEGEFRKISLSELTGRSVVANRFSEMAMKSFYQLCQHDEKIQPKLVKPYLGQLNSVMDTSTGFTQMLAMNLLAQFPGHRPKVLTHYRDRALSTSDPNEKRNNVVRAANMGDQKLIFDELAFELVQSEERDDVMTALYYYYKTGRTNMPVLPVIKRIISVDSYSSSTDRAFLALTTLKQYVDDSVPFLMEEAAIAEDYLKQDFLGTLNRLGRNNPESVPHFVAGLDAKDPLVRAVSAATLGDIGGPAKHALPVLKEKLASETAGIRQYYKQAITKLEAVR